MNYKNYNDTINCIKSILQQTYQNYNIVVVDNNSQNESINEINNYIQGKDNIFFLKNEKNLGFAKGNNIGIKFAREKLQCDFVFVLNSDTILNDKDSLKKLIDSYVPNSKLALINPMCCDLEGNIQLPYLIYSSKMWKYCVKMGVYLIKQFVKLIFNLDKYIKNKKIIVDFNKIKANKYVIQGCAYILTPDFFEYYTQIYPETFLYCEETALAIYIEKAKLRTITNFDVIIVHKEGGSSKEVLKDKKKQKLKYQVHSYFKVIKLIMYKYENIRKKFFNVKYTLGIKN